LEIIQHYFPTLSNRQAEQFAQLDQLYRLWNDQINVISRKDIDQLYEHHVLHSLAIAKVMPFAANTRVLDVGTGGGFPGIPLAIMFPEVQFMLVDSIGKKLKVVEAVSNELKLNNVQTFHGRAEIVKGSYHFVVSRAVTTLSEFWKWIDLKFARESFNALPNGVLYLKGGDLQEELKPFKQAQVYPIKDFFTEEFFETKAVVHVPASKK
jgi:16S rRNA (guanine527-N7)-methyltransferase